MNKQQAWYQGWPVVEKIGTKDSGWWGPPRGTHAGTMGSRPPDAYADSFNALKTKGKKQALGLIEKTGRRDFTEHNIKILEDGLERRRQGTSRLMKSLRNTEAAMEGKQNFAWRQAGGSKESLRTASKFLKKRIERQTKSYWEDAGYIAGGKAALQEVG